ncbi:flavodoxin family protein [Microbacter margulisiae]|uniref:Multimeric flavodoxin WrbA n=1 Tax=Microbacter margulisiae TaxID=1350067 RepID=A0A7W5DRM5_9PORP|nr:flavodoxin family protein [Microbacter margulisiae]MBB3187478.1 multimeric flavodoxin WrbA [Microbacter margulisiae]
MKKNILVISGSPRKGGNSDLLCDRLMEGAQSVGHQTEKIYIRDKKINYCTGCGNCFNKRLCSQKDDMAEVLEKMIDANVIVMATPVYFYTLNAQMKTLIDRCCARYTEINGKEFCFIMTAADGNKNSLERTLESFRGFTDCLDGAIEKGVIYGTGVWQKGEVKGKTVMEEAYRMGASL